MKRKKKLKLKDTIENKTGWYWIFDFSKACYFLTSIKSLCGGNMLEEGSDNAKESLDLKQWNNANIQHKVCLDCAKEIDRIVRIMKGLENGKYPPRK